MERQNMEIRLFPQHLGDKSIEEEKKRAKEEEFEWTFNSGRELSQNQRHLAGAYWSDIMSYIEQFLEEIGVKISNERNKNADSLDSLHRKKNDTEFQRRKNKRNLGVYRRQIKGKPTTNTSNQERPYNTFL